MKHWLVFVMAFSLSPFVEAKNGLLPGKVAIHIANVHYEHPVRMLHPFYDYWHMRGPAAEKAALNAMKKRFANVAWCNQSNPAEVVVSLEPRMFYNPQLRVFHAEFSALVYNQAPHNGELPPAIFKVKERAQALGELSLKPEVAIEKAYTQAMKNIINALITNPAFLASLNVPHPKQTERVCPALDALPERKIYY